MYHPKRFLQVWLLVLFQLQVTCTFSFLWTSMSSSTTATAAAASSSLSSSSSSSYDGPIVALNVILRIKPDVRDRFLHVIGNNQRGTLQNEPLAVEYSFGPDADEPNTFHFHEKYQGDAGLAAHNAAPHFKEWEAFAQTNPFTAPPQVYKFYLV